MSSRQKAFTLIELMIVVAIMGVLAAVATPAFINYLKKAKTAEVAGNLHAMYVGTATYYETEHVGRGLLTTFNVDATQTHCICRGNGGMPSPVGSYKRVGDWSRDATFKAINFAPADPVYYVYAFTRVGDSICDVEANIEEIVKLSAVGDLDDDHFLSLFSITVGTNDDAELMRAPGIYKENELE